MLDHSGHVRAGREAWWGRGTRLLSMPEFRWSLVMGLVTTSGRGHRPARFRCRCHDPCLGTYIHRSFPSSIRSCTPARRRTAAVGQCLRGWRQVDEPDIPDQGPASESIWEPDEGISQWCRGPGMKGWFLVPVAEGLRPKG